MLSLYGNANLDSGLYEDPDYLLQFHVTNEKVWSGIWKICHWSYFLVIHWHIYIYIYLIQQIQLRLSFKDLNLKL